MKKAWIVTAVLLFVSAAAGFSRTPDPSVAPLSAEALAAILDEPVDDACPKPQEDAVFAARRPSFFKTCSATATCSETGTSVSCTFTGSGGSCTFTNQNCPNGVRGQVNCNGTIKQCPICECGSIPACCRCEATGNCFDCCRCDGGGPRVCSEECGLFP